MELKQIEEGVEKAIQGVIHVPDYDPDMDFYDEIGISSLEVMLLLGELERMFSMRLYVRELKYLSTPRELAELIQKKYSK